MAQVDQAKLRGPFLESPGLFRAGKLFYVCRVCQQSFNNSENDKMKLSVILNKANFTGLLARFQQVLILRFAFGPKTFPALSRLSTLSLLERVPFLASLKMRDFIHVSV